MADAPNTSSYILESADTADLPNSRTLNPASASGGIRIQDSGAGGALSIDTVGNLSALNAYATNGLMAYNSAGSPVFSGKTIMGSSSINVVNGNGVSGNPTLSVIDDTSIQQINLQLNTASDQAGTTAATDSTLNLIAGTGVSIGITPNGTYNRADITISAPASVIPNPLPVNQGGTGRQTLTANAILLGAGTSPIASVGPLTNGQLIVGSTGNVPVATTLTAGAGIQITNAAGSITITNTGGGGGSGLTSVGLTSDRSTAVITGSPLTSNGAINIEIPNWATVAAAADTSIQMQNSNLAFLGSMDFAYGNAGDTIILQGTPNSMPPGIKITQGLTLDVGIIYDNFFNPIGGTGTAGQVLALVSNPSGSNPGTPQALHWVNAGGGGGGVPYTTTPATNLQVGNATNLGTGAVNNVIFSPTAYGSLTGEENTFVGSTAGATLTTGGSNTFIGFGAGNGITVGGGNTAIGYETGPITGSSNGCIFIGNEAQADVANLVNAILMGDQSRISVSDACVIGNEQDQMVLGIGTKSPNSNAQIHLSQAGGSPTPSAIIIESMTGSDVDFYTSPAGLPANSLYFAQGNISNAASVPLMATGSSVKMGGVALYNTETLVSGVYPVGAVPYTANSAPNYLNFSAAPTTDGTYGFGLEISAGNISPHWFTAPASVSELAASVAFIGQSTPQPPPTQLTSYIAFPDPTAPDNPTEFELPFDFTLGNSFRIVGLNPYGWVLSTALGSGITQKIVYNDQVVTGDNATLAGIQCDPVYATSPAAEYLSTSIELVYAKLQDDGAQVWVIYAGQGVIDLFQS